MDRGAQIGTSLVVSVLLIDLDQVKTGQVLVLVLLVIELIKLLSLIVIAIVTALLKLLIKSPPPTW